MDLVDMYRRGAGFYFGGPRRTLVTDGVAVTLPGRGGEAPQRAEVVLRALGDDQVLVGAVPFDDDAPAHLVVPDRIAWGRSTPASPALPAAVITSMPIPEPSESQYVSAVQGAIDEMSSSDLAKVVLARSLRLTMQDEVDIPQLLRRLRTRDAHGYVFAVDLPGGSTLVGASPELLVSRRGGTVVAQPLAGSRPRIADDDVNRRRAAELLASEKDRHEHALVVEAIAATLRPFCRTLGVPTTPTVVATSTMLHLGTDIRGALVEPLPSALTLAAALHPTPAVCGTPRTAARGSIARLEGFDRGFYAGMVGWCDAAGDGEWAVTIRCAEAADRSLRLFAGAGIVAGSAPEDELAETNAKFATMLSALGVRVEEGDDARLHALA